MIMYDNNNINTLYIRVCTIILLLLKYNITMIVPNTYTQVSVIFPGHTIIKPNKIVRYRYSVKKLRCFTYVPHL